MATVVLVIAGGSAAGWFLGPPENPPAAAGSPSPSPPGSTAGSERAADAAQVARAWELFFAGSTPAAAKISLLQNGSSYAAVVDSQATSPLARQVSASVKKVTLQTPDRATVVYDIVAGGQPVLSAQVGTAVRVGGRWLVSDAAFCALLALSGPPPAPCPTGGAGTSP